MSSNRRGFIGIFSQNHDQDDARDTENDSVKSEEKSKKQGGLESLEDGDEPKSAVASDWNDIFEDKARSAFPPAEAPAVNPVAAAIASKTKRESTESSQAKDEKSEPIETVNKISGSDAVDENATYTSKAMTHGPSSKSILSKSDRQAITDAIQTLREKLSFARQASGDERDGLMKLGTTGRDFINQATKVVSENPDVLPRSFDDESFVNDAELIEALRNIGDDLRDLTQRVADTESKIASSAFAGALLVHRSGGIDADKGKSEAYRKSTGSQANGSSQTDRERQFVDEPSRSMTDQSRFAGTQNR